MTRYVLRRVALSVVTLWLVVTIVFMINNVFPSDVGRRLAGPFQSQEIVDEINEELGTNDPLIVQYGRMLNGVASGKLDRSRLCVRPDTSVCGGARSHPDARQDRHRDDRPASSTPTMHDHRPVATCTARPSRWAPSPTAAP